MSLTILFRLFVERLPRLTRPHFYHHEALAHRAALRETTAKARLQVRSRI